MKKLLIFLLFASANMVQLNAQAGDLAKEDATYIQGIEDTLSLLAFATINDSLEANRFGATRELAKKLVQALKRPNSFNYKFDRLSQYVSIQYPQDSTFRVFSWQLFVNDKEYRYYGAIQVNESDLKLFGLIDRSFQMQGNLEQMTTNPEEWYGALYYGIHETEGPQGKYYILFGYDHTEFFRQRKIAEVLYFRDGKPQFGAPVFIDPQSGRTKNRLVIEYSAATSAGLRYDEIQEIIIFDHLLTMNGQYGEGPTNFPDGSYEGYKEKDGMWHYIEKVYDIISDEAPRPYPVLDRDETIKKGKNNKN